MDLFGQPQSTTLIMQVAFIVAFAALSPGPDIILLSRLSLSRGRWPALSAAFGICLGNTFHISASALGLSFIRNEVFLTTLKFAGAGYISYLAVMILLEWQKNRKNKADLSTRTPATSKKLFSFFGQGLLTNLLNPKAALFYVSILAPMFSQARMPWFYWLLILIPVLMGSFGGFCLLATAQRTQAPLQKIMKWSELFFAAALIYYAINLLGFS